MIIARWDAVDFDYDLFESVASALDGHLDKLDEYTDDVDADAFGIFDDADNTVGLGFAAAQTYVAGVCRWERIDKVTALAVGPRHADGPTVAAIVNAAANLWNTGTSGNCSQ
jgi:hypothetical protein